VYQARRGEFVAHFRTDAAHIGYQKGADKRSIGLENPVNCLPCPLTGTDQPVSPGRPDDRRALEQQSSPRNSNRSACGYDIARLRHSLFHRKCNWQRTILVARDPAHVGSHAGLAEESHPPRISCKETRLAVALAGVMRGCHKQSGHAQTAHGGEGRIEAANPYRDTCSRSGAAEREIAAESKQESGGVGSQRDCHERH